MAMLSEHGIRLSSMSPSFLNSNSTSHTWPFSAVAELIDNATDPGVCAKQIWIDVLRQSGHLCLSFIDNGCGMTPNKLHKMLSFGFTEKSSIKSSHQAIGVYGNGFKSGSMRLGRDALIFTKNGGCQSLGMLSQTYLENIKAQAVIVPIVPFYQQTNILREIKSLVVTEDSKASLAAILQNSIVTSLEQIHAHFDSIPSKKGTKILIWNIRRAKDGNPEIDFETDKTDFRLPSIHIEELVKSMRSNGSLKAEENVPEMQYSLRAYLSLLYLKPRTQIILRGKKSVAKLMSKMLKHVEHDVYKPHSKDKVRVTFGMIPQKKEHYGIMLYHKNRLIKAYEKVGCQVKTLGHRAGVGVMGIIECNFLKPAHNKQDFEYTKEYRLTLSALGVKLNDYWRAVTDKHAREREFQAMSMNESEDEHNDEAPMWLQCEECLKWRSISPSHYNQYPESWTCSQNPNPRYRSCSIPEEAENSEELSTASYQKTHKKLISHVSQPHKNYLEHPKSLKQGKSFVLLEKLPQNQLTKHLSSLHTSSVSVQSTSAGSCHSGDENAGEPDEMNTDHIVDYDEDTHANDDVMTAQQQPVEHKTDGQRNEVTDMGTNTNIEFVEREEKTDTLSHKRKSGPVLHSAIKRPCPWETQQPGSEETTAQQSDGSSHTQKANVFLPIFNSITWSPSLHSTQTVEASHLKKGPGCKNLPPEENEHVSNKQKLIGLEKEAQRLRQLLGLEVTKTTQGTMTTGDCCPDKANEHLMTPLGSKTSREVGCQADITKQSSPLSCSLQRGLEKETEQSQTRKKTETQSMKTIDDEASEDSRSLKESLHNIRKNVVVLLKVLLPQLDLAGISLETSDVNNILQKVVEVNSLKL